MKKIFFIVLSLCLLVLIHPKQSFAHFLATDKNIGAVLHIDPNDAPVAGEQAGFFFEIKDKINKFKATDCSCRVDILENDTVIYSDAVFTQNTDPNLSTASLFYTLPKTDVYTIKLIGTPRSSNAFAPFILSWDIRVDQQEKASTNFFTTPFVLIAAGILLFLLFAFLGKRFIIKSKDGEKHDKETDSPVY